MSKKLVIGLPAVLILGIASIVVYQVLNYRVVVELSQSQIQEQLDARFPIRKRQTFFSVVLSEPVVNLEEGSDRLDFSITIDLKLLQAKTLKGTTQVSGKVRYQPETGAFYFDEALVKQLDISGVPGMFEGEIKPLIKAAMVEYLQTQPVYQLKPKDTPRSLIRLLVKSVNVEQSKLKVTLGVR
jgi:hypothetical protein